MWQDNFLPKWLSILQALEGLALNQYYAFHTMPCTVTSNCTQPQTVEHSVTHQTKKTIALCSMLLLRLMLAYSQLTMQLFSDHQRHQIL
jgi:hypothetical protein